MTADGPDMDLVEQVRGIRRRGGKGNLVRTEVLRIRPANRLFSEEVVKTLCRIKTGGRRFPYLLGQRILWYIDLYEGWPA